MGTPTDRELIEAVRAGDGNQFGPLIDRYSPRLVRYVTHLVGSADDAHDVVQETFIAAYRNLWAFDITRPFLNWLYRIAHNQAMNWLRARHRLVYGERADLILQQKTGNDRPDDTFAANEFTQAVRDAVDELPLVYREPLILSALDGYSYTEISDMLRIPLNTVGSRISRGKSLLRTIWEQKGHHHE